jgi:hypothetical protein
VREKEFKKTWGRNKRKITREESGNTRVESIKKPMISPKLHMQSPFSTGIKCRPLINSKSCSFGQGCCVLAVATKLRDIS